MALHRREALVLAGVAAAAAATGFVVGPRLFHSRTEEAEALSAAVFPDLAGKPRRLAEWRGKITLLNFWATWCAPCLEEIPMLVRTRHRFLKSDVQIVGIAVDFESSVSEFSRNMKIDYPVLVADSGGLELMRKLGNSAGGLPYSVFLDRSGVPFHRKLGALKAGETEALISVALRG